MIEEAFGKRFLLMPEVACGKNSRQDQENFLREFPVVVCCSYCSFAVEFSLFV